MRFKLRPDPQEALVFCSETYLASPERSFLILVGECSVDYSGRAKSRLGQGERVVMVKPDGTVMVHTNSKREPVNWQPPNTKVGFEVADGAFTLRSRRKKPEETMDVRFASMEIAIAAELRDTEKLRLVGMEADFVDRLEAEPSLIEPGLRVLRREKQTRSGSIDLLCVDRQGVPVVIEAKRSQAGLPAASQLIAYIGDYRRRNKDANVRGMLVAPRVQEKAKVLLAEKGLEFRELECSFALADEKQSTLGDWGENASKVEHRAGRGAGPKASRGARVRKKR